MDFDAPEYDYGSESDGLQSACSNDLDEQSGTLALLEYARFHHLSEDYTTVNPLVADVLCLSAPDPLYSAEFEDDHCYTPDITSDEKLSLDKGGTMFLKCALGAATGDSELCTEPVRRSKMYYTEEPLLSSDARLDYKIFTHTPHIILAVDSATLYKSSELNDVTKLLVWLEPAEIESNMENALAEKVQLTPDDISFLQKAFNARYPAYHYDPSSTQRRVKLWNDNPQYGTPPLLARSLSFSPTPLALPIGQLPLVSSPKDPDDHILKDIDQQLKEETFETPSDLTSYHLLDTIGLAQDQQADMAAADAVRHHVAPTKRRLAAALKEELPLTPAQSQYSPKKKLKTVAFSEALTTDVLLHGRAFSPDAYEDPAGDDDDDAAGSLEHIIGLAAEVAIREAEHEQLSEADSTMRVEVPPIDHSLPDVPWSVDHTAFAGRRLFPNRDTSNEMMSMLLRCLDDNKACFPRSQLDRTVRVWEPFPLHLGNVSTNEILDDGSLERYLTKLEFASTKASIWKPEGLRILDEPDREDDGIEPLHVGLFQDTEVIVDDLQTRLRRHRSIARPKAHGAANMSHATDPPITEQEYIKQIAGHEVVPSSHGERRSSTLNGAFSAYASLGRFMQTQSSVPLSEDFNKGENQNSLPQDNPEAQSQPLAHDCTRTSCRPLVSAPTPAIAVRAASSLPAAQFILSSSLLSCRGLLRKVESRYPAAQFIDRDFDMRKPVYETTHPSSVDEGDLILSPSTGLMFTTLQHIKQKPLPGQTTHNGVLERIAELADRYERLFVLVSNGQSSNCTGDQQSHCLDERDCLGLASLYSSVARLNADVRILFVPDGEDALADWTVNCMAKYSAHEQANLLVQEETLWEVILRKAGLNTFAGQSILSKLKGTDCYVKALPTKLTKQSFGMTALVLMDTDERRTYLSSSMDGEKLLKHVSRAIDGIWRSPI